MGAFLRKLFWGVIINSLGILACEEILNYFLQDFSFEGTVYQLILLALVLTLLNLLVKPIIRFIFLPLIWFTLGIFGFVINLTILKIAIFLIPGTLIIHSSLTWLAASIIISAFNSLLHSVK